MAFSMQTEFLETQDIIEYEERIKIQKTISK